jgi:hypothetical protein
MKALPKLTLVYLCAACCACTKKEATAQPQPQQLFDSMPSSKSLFPILQEVSGIVDSKTVPHHLWAEEDGGNPPQIWLVSYNGAVQKKVYVKGAVNRDWEDMTRSGTDLYVADIGDNNRVFSEYAIYKFREPAIDADTVFSFEEIRFRYADGAHDAEAFLVDPATKDIILITKRDSPSAIYKIAFPYSTSKLNIAIKMGQLTYSGAVSAALSPDAKEIIVKTYSALYYYSGNNQTLVAALQKAPIALRYLTEPQGEAVCLAADNSGFFTLSEKGFSSTVNLYFYKRR